MSPGCRRVIDSRKLESAKSHVDIIILMEVLDLFLGGKGRGNKRKRANIYDVMALDSPGQTSAKRPVRTNARHIHATDLCPACLPKASYVFVGVFLRSIACVSHLFVRVEHDINNRLLPCFSVVLFLTDPEHVVDASLTIRYRYDENIAFLSSVALFAKVASN